MSRPGTMSLFWNSKVWNTTHPLHFYCCQSQCLLMHFLLLSLFPDNGCPLLISFWCFVGESRSVVAALIFHIHTVWQIGNCTHRGKLASEIDVWSVSDTWSEWSFERSSGRSGDRWCATIGEWSNSFSVFVGDPSIIRFQMGHSRLVDGSLLTLHFFDFFFLIGCCLSRAGQKRWKTHQQIV